MAEVAKGDTPAASSRPSPVSLQEPDPSPFTWLGTRSCRKIFLVQRRLNARAPPRGQPRPQRHPPTTIELLQPRSEIGGWEGAGRGGISSSTLTDAASGTSDFSETPPPQPPPTHPKKGSERPRNIYSLRILCFALCVYIASSHHPNCPAPSNYAKLCFIFTEGGSREPLPRNLTAWLSTFSIL